MEELTPYTATEVATILRCGVRVIYSLIHKGKLQAVRVGIAWQITRAAVEAYLAEK